jgi:hypothetical protein
VADNGDGKGCSDAKVAPTPKDQAVSASDVTPQQTNVNAQQGSLWAFLIAPQVPRYVPNDVPLSPRSQAAITAIANAAPAICGGGGYAYYGTEFEAGPVSSFTGAIVELDSKSGRSSGALQEVGVGEGAVVGLGTIVTQGGSGKAAASSFVYGGPGIKSPVVSASAGTVGFTTGIGVYGELFVAGQGGGIGAYLNIANNAYCNKGGH